MKMKYIYLLLILVFPLKVLRAQPVDSPPGVVINHIPANLDRFIGSPSICILPDGNYIVSHDEFGPTSTEFKSAITRIYVSVDKGKSWKRISQINGQFWSTLFYLNGALYIIGTNKHHGNLVLRRSDDYGKTWTIPYDGKNGLLLEGEYHTAPTPVLIHKGRIWRAVEYATARTTKWGERYSAMVVSAPLNSDLMNAGNWTRTNHLYYNPDYLNGSFQAWLDGNVVATPSGEVVDVLRVQVPKGHKEVMALVKVNLSGDSVSFASSDFYDMPGAAKKFTIRYDTVTQRYWSLVNEVPDSLQQISPNSVRNMVTLVSSLDLKKWKRHKVVLFHPDHLRHGFQYVDWLFEKNDIIFVSRTAYDDNTGGAKNNHDANFITFHRIENFRAMTAD